MKNIGEILRKVGITFLFFVVVILVIIAVKAVCKSVSYTHLTLPTIRLV